MLYSIGDVNVQYKARLFQLVILIILIISGSTEHKNWFTYRVRSQRILPLIKTLIPHV